MGYDYNEKKQESVYSKRIKAGKRRTYFFDVRATKGNDYYLTITESRKRFDSDNYDRHKIFLYKEDFNKFAKALTEAVEYVKTDLMPDFDFDAFNHEYSEENSEAEMIPATTETVIETPVLEKAEVTEEKEAEETHKAYGADELVDKW
ncbi:DUF3276 family protein [Polluticaenibacter yanchengensis]|uniref:DUF3276 family protein n=1 Tax=Polluticaenibacter yanchengensis TaxID=3014562 RepID=A0ABT4UJZ4_9BACT|nr:DUF3276 family protein [Chitinophagaceae bacterium LY-5]